MTYSKKITNTVKGGSAFRQHNGQAQRPPTWGMGVRRWYGQPSPFAFPTNSSNQQIRLFPRDQILLMKIDDIKELTPEVRMALSGRITPAEFRMMTPGIQLAWNPNVPRTPHIPFGVTAHMLLVQLLKAKLVDLEVLVVQRRKAQTTLIIDIEVYHHPEIEEIKLEDTEVHPLIKITYICNK